MNKKRVLKKWCKNLLYIINCLIFCFWCMVNDINDIKITIILFLISAMIFYINYKILKKYN